MFVMKFEAIRKKIQYTVLRARAIFILRPKLAIPIFAVATIIIFGIFECGRAWFYLRSINDYRASSSMQMLQQTIDKLARSVESNAPSYYCAITEKNLIAEDNQAYNSLGEGDNAPERLVVKIREQLDKVDPAPAYSSLLEFLPLAKKARKSSVDMHDAIVAINKMVQDDTRSKYCLELRDALSRVYFIADLQTPEGVSALQPGQVENFQVSVSQARDLFLTMRFPEGFSEKHTSFIKILNEVAVSLRQNDNDYVAFSRRLEMEKTELDTLLESIKNMTTDLQGKPKLMLLQVHLLNGDY